MPGVRPTSGLVRTAIFDILGNFDFSIADVLDLFAGTGSLGIEALSRGARCVDFVEDQPRQCSVIKENLVHTGLSSRAKVHCMKVQQALGQLKGKYNLVLMDPPYKLETLGDTLQSLSTCGILAKHAIVVAGHSKRITLDKTYNGLEVVRRNRYGDSSIDFLELGCSQ